MLAGLVFAAAHHARRLAGAAAIGPAAWGAVALNAAVAGVLAGWTIENVPIESLDIGGWLRSLSFAALAIAAPIAGAAAMGLPVGPPAFARIIGAKSERARDPLALTLGVLLIGLTVLAVQSALALSFDPRYRDFPFAPLTAAALPFLLLSFVAAPVAGARPRAETVAAAVLGRAPSLLFGTRRSPIGRRCGLPQRWLWSRSACFGHGSRQAEDQKRDGERGQRRVVEHDAGAAREQRQRPEHHRRPQ